MKVKRLPEDFTVEERTEFRPGRGPFALYTLTKRSLGTPEALEAIARRWNLPREVISFGGLKDRHALTTQWITIRGGPGRGLKQTNLELRYVGQAPRPFGPKDILGNRFRIVLRDFSKEGEARARKAVDEVGRDPVPNYFDDQRFGSLGPSGDFVGRAWCEQKYERAVWLALAEENEHDRPEDRSEKEILRGKWGDWSAVKAALSKSHRRSIVTFLADRPGDFKGALARIHAEMRGLYLSAFQSFLWNRLLSTAIREICAPAQLAAVPLKVGEALFFGPLEDGQREKLKAIVLPLPSARARLTDEPMKERVERSLREVGLDLKSLRIRHPRENFFSRGDRAATFAPGGLSSAWDTDDLYPGRRKLELKFDLPRGSYATILVKRITLP